MKKHSVHIAQKRLNYFGKYSKLFMSDLYNDFIKPK